MARLIDNLRHTHCVVAAVWGFVIGGGIGDALAQDGVATAAGLVSAVPPEAILWAKLAEGSPLAVAVGAGLFLLARRGPPTIRHEIVMVQSDTDAIAAAVAKAIAAAKATP